MRKQLVILFLSLGFINSVEGQGNRVYPISEESVASQKQDTVHIHDTIYISKLDDVTRAFGMSFDEYVHTFMTVKEAKDTLNTIPTEKIYLNYFLPLLNVEQPLFNYRIIFREYIINPVDMTVNLQLIEYPQADLPGKTNLPTDCLLTIYGTNQTDLFLKSPTQIKSCLEQLFEKVYHSNGKIKGVNFYFPDYTFKEKRAMAQFIKSASIVADSCKLKSIRDLRFYASFNNDQAKDNESFLDGIAQMTDSIFVFHYAAAENILPEIRVINSLDAKSLNLFSKLQNQFYLARYYTKPFPETSSAEFKIQDIDNLIEADYPNNQWEIFLCAVIGIVLFLLIILVLHLTIPTVSYYVNKNIDYVYSLLVMLFLEILLLIGNMFEAMSKDNIFSLNNDNRYIMLLFPLLFIFIFPMMKAIGKKRNLP